MQCWANGERCLIYPDEDWPAGFLNIDHFYCNRCYYSNEVFFDPFSESYRAIDDFDEKSLVDGAGILLEALELLFEKRKKEVVGIVKKKLKKIGCRESDIDEEIIKSDIETGIEKDKKLDQIEELIQVARRIKE